MGEGVARCHSADARRGLRSCDSAPLFGQAHSGWLVVESASAPLKRDSRLPRHSARRLLISLSDCGDYFVAVGQVGNDISLSNHLFVLLMTTLGVLLRRRTPSWPS